MRTLLLDRTFWDLVLDLSGNIAVADEPYAMAQDAASSIRTFLGEVYYDTSLGMPYLQSILGKFPSAQFIKTSAVREVLRVPGVASAKMFLTLDGERRLGGQVQITSTMGVVAAASTKSLPVLPPDNPWFGQFDFTQDRQSAWFVEA